MKGLVKSHGVRDLPPELLVVDAGKGATLRLAEPDEYDRVGGILVRAFETNGPMSQLYRRRLTSIAQRSESEDIWVISSEDGDLYGACTTVKPERWDRPYFEFNTMGVAPEGRSRGFGRLFVSHSIGLARAFGFGRVLIHSGPNMVPAHWLYEKCGFERHPELETLVVDGGQRLLVYTYDLDSSR